MEKKYQIFVSSTYTDLIAARNKVIEAILSMYHLPVGMEMFSADNIEQWEVIKETIIDCDYYILIIGHRYGSLTREGISFTEKEFDFAVEQKIPIMAFIRKRDVATLPDERDDGPIKIKKLNNFIEKAKSDRMCEFWSDYEELAKKISIALTKIIKRTPRIGWVKADKAISHAVTEELARLSSENNLLRNELDEVKKSIVIRKPALKIFINNQEKIELIFNDDFVPMEIPSIDIIEQHIMESQKKRIVRITKDLKLPDNFVVAEFNSIYERYWRLINTGEIVSLKLSNNGNIKTDNYYFSIQFPPEIIVCNVDKINNHPPMFPINYNVDKAFVELLYPFYYASEKKENETVINMKKYDYRLLKEDGNQIQYSSKNLLHSLKVEIINKYKIVPLKKGEFKAKVHIICDEYEDPDIYDIPIIVK